ncbi:phage tail sheath subtilisin-like domain-containing protein [Edwardsiella piscicida]|uniref:phage tail sheath subtilisin-like domain-containing protein n=1 Tax=Edwardsiella piscicida TaxID=1263550 RepID=UPI00101ACEF4|nr:phage tail sheath subtilisin-like domain-containing protein [Edwardsiella piscicida]ELM3734800.1 phage tail sheath subtilisin-like domain-containing protein [Edwardsiella piscicida]QBB14238.1 phage tail protein [Edwardsiella piscicida]WGS78518.1 phage tail sheath subtilisin-like domain-containing protein [Edwardsiella piscicida]WGS81903.1 phage tail sheath subtilisin-like domain-containing protein [Edwardsiella piscicida]
MALGSIPDDVRCPLVYIEIDNSQALSGAPAQSRKVIVIGHQSAAGAATALTQNRITSDGTAEKLYGKGSMLAEMLKAHRKANSYTETWAMGLADLTAGAAAKASLTVVGTATAAGTLALLINGVSVQVGVNVGDDKDAVANAIIAAIAKYPATQVTASLKTAATDCVELTANWKGVSGNSMDIRLNYYPGEQIPSGISVTATTFSGGTGTPDMTAVVAALGDDWYTDIEFGFNDTQSLNTLRDELIVRWGPLKMIEAQLWSAYRGTHAESGTFGDARNDWLISCMSTNIAPQPHWLWAASYGGIASYYLAIDPARPLQTLVMPGVLPPSKEVRWDMPERNLLLHDGMATHFVDAGGNVCIEREITMYRVNQFGDPDTSYLDVQSPATLGRIRYIIKNRFSNRYPRHKLAGDDVLDLLDPGQPVMTPKIARAELLDIALTELVPAGLVEDFDDYKATLDVYIDSKDKNRLNFIVHPNLVNQLRVLAGLIQFKQ